MFRNFADPLVSRICISIFVDGGISKLGEATTPSVRFMKREAVVNIRCGILISTYSAMQSQLQRELVFNVYEEALLNGGKKCVKVNPNFDQDTFSKLQHEAMSRARQIQKELDIPFRIRGSTNLALWILEELSKS